MSTCSPLCVLVSQVFFIRYPLIPVLATFFAPIGSSSLSLYLCVSVLRFRFGLYLFSAPNAEQIYFWLSSFFTFDTISIAILLPPRAFLTHEIRCCRKVLKNSFNGPKEFLAVKLFTQYNSGMAGKRKWMSRQSSSAHIAHQTECYSVAMEMTQKIRAKNGKICKQQTTQCL